MRRLIREGTMTTEAIAQSSDTLVSSDGRSIMLVPTFQQG
jgi:hypothetical protein